MLNFGNEQSLERAAGAFSQAAAVLSVAGGAAVLFGWVFEIETLIAIAPNLAAMKVNTAVAFVLLGVALWSIQARPQRNRLPAERREGLLLRLSYGCAALVALLGLLILGEYLFGWELGIDNFIIRDRYTSHNPYPGRMAPMTAVDFLLLGLAFLTINLETRTGKRPAQWLAIAVFLDGFIAVVGYAYDVESLYSVGGYSSMALHTALLVAVVSVGCLCARPGKGLMVLATDTTAGGWMFRRLLPTAVLLVPLLGWLKLLGQRAGLYGFEFGLALLVMSNVAILSALIWWTAALVRTQSFRRAETEQLAAVLEKRVHERTAELEETVAELEHSAYIISHNLRAPVRAVLAFADFLVADFAEKLDATGRDYVDRIKTSAQRMDKLIEAVLAYSQVSRSELHLTSVNLDTLVDALAPDHDGSADIRISHPLGSVRASECLLDQAISNLLENAAKFVRPGTTPKIEIWTEAQEGKLRLVIRDHGIGVPPESVNRLFRSFERAQESYEGVGMGLAIARRAVERMNGRIGFDSRPGEGSSFWLELPKD